jgi:hypothetical protein
LISFSFERAVDGKIGIVELIFEILFVFVYPFGYFEEEVDLDGSIPTKTGEPIDSIAIFLFERRDGEEIEAEVEIGDEEEEASEISRFRFGEAGCGVIVRF